MKVMILDEDSELCEELAELLRSEGHDVDTATDGARAAQLAGENRYDMLLFDLEVTGVNRPGLLEMFKSRNPSIKTCVITGGPFVEWRLEKEKISPFVSAVIRKPLSAGLLLERVSALAAG